MAESFPIIDIFAGPGGLGEGFSAFVDNNKHPFKIALSIEKDATAHKTLLLRSFFRQFNGSRVPDNYYDFVRGKITLDKLFDLHPEEAKAAKDEAWCTILGSHVSHAEIDKRIAAALNKSDNWLLIGGPPCQAYSLIGRARNNGISESDPRVYLYREYYRILAKHRPPVFVMENVKGLLSSKLNEEKIFETIIRDLKNPYEGYTSLFGNDLKKEDCPTYRIYSLVKSPAVNVLGEEIDDPRDFIIKCEKYGIPQKRHRVILLGIRSDWKYSPLYLEQKPTVTIETAIGDLPKLRSGLSKGEDTAEHWINTIKNEFLSLKNSLSNSPDFDEAMEKMDEVIQKLAVPANGRGKQFIPVTSSPGFAKKWFFDGRLGGISNHESRGHMKEDLLRYLFQSCFAEAYQASAKLEDLPESLLPKHKNVSEAIKKGIFNDRFRVQLKGEPSTTIASHIAKDGHYYIHYDPMQCRALTVREAARLQTFPDNYFFFGPRTSQYTQVGNAVPPLLANQIAAIIYKLFTLNINSGRQDIQRKEKLEHVPDQRKEYQAGIGCEITSA
jgi:DNA (cytosine-5)-methyltransferase 1